MALMWDKDLMVSTKKLSKKIEPEYLQKTETLRPHLIIGT